MQDFAAYAAGLAQGQADKMNRMSSMTPPQYAENPDYAAGYAAASVEPHWEPPDLSNRPTPPRQTSMSPISEDEEETIKRYVPPSWEEQPHTDPKEPELPEPPEAD